MCKLGIARFQLRNEVEGGELGEIARRVVSAAVFDEGVVDVTHRCGPSRVALVHCDPIAVSADPVITLLGDAPPSREPAGPFARTTPVSYTHLRAHETDSYL